MTNANKKGFTIIEVVLVLAIAGLIFAMVFIALPALQRSQRDGARKNDASTVAAAVNNYRSSRKTLQNLDNATKLAEYIDKLDQYDKSTDLERAGEGQINLTPDKDKIYFAIKSKCPTELPAPAESPRIELQKGTSRTAAVVVLLENNGSKSQIHCVDA